uniref:Uncharacterized protein n=1 Tax=Tetraselmis sp. GSL018 TaxID=582737 RepID=A0A061RL05_9CHLO
MIDRRGDKGGGRSCCGGTAKEEGQGQESETRGERKEKKVGEGVGSRERHERAEPTRSLEKEAGKGRNSGERPWRREGQRNREQRLQRETVVPFKATPRCVSPDSARLLHLFLLLEERPPPSPEGGPQRPCRATGGAMHPPSLPLPRIPSQNFAANPIKIYLRGPFVPRGEGAESEVRLTFQTD